MKIFKAIILVILAVVFLAAALFAASPRTFLVQLLFVVGLQPELGAKGTLENEVYWVEDYFAVESIGAKTIAIGEPRYWQKNVSYLILGNDRALLFDSGPGVRNIKEVVEKLTKLPVLVVASHLHYDHVGNHDKFTHIMMLDQPKLRQQIDPDGYFKFEDLQHLGRAERVKPPHFKVERWLKAGEGIDLGGRTLQVLGTPGHTEESIMLYDPQSHQLFTGDFLYAGTLLPEHMGSYLKTTEQLLSFLPRDIILLGAHAVISDPWSVPQLGYQNLVDLEKTLEEIHRGSGLLPGVVKVDSQISIMVPFKWNRDWKKSGG